MTLISTWHPTFALFHSPWETGAFVTDLDRFARLLKGQLEDPPAFIRWRTTVAQIRQLKALALKLREPISVDIETGPCDMDRPWTGKDPTQAVLRTVGLGLTVGGVSHRWTHKWVAVEYAIKLILEDAHVPKVGQNFTWFDHRVLLRHGINVRNIDDTRDARRAISATSKLSLAHMGSIYTDYIAWKENESDDEKGIIFTKSKKKLGIYNAHDCVVTSRAWKGLTQEADWATPRVQRLYAVHQSLARIAAEMHSTGLRVDHRTRKWMAWALEKEYYEKEKKVLKAVGIKGFECTPNHFRALIFKKHATGKYSHLGRFQLDDPIDKAMYVNEKEMDKISVDEDALTLLLIDPSTPAELKAIIQLYWGAQEIWKRRSTSVVSKKVSQAIGPDGKLRAGWNSAGTDTGRFTCKDPSLQVLEKLMRAMYIADKGCELVGFDYSQLELRVMQVETQDQALGAGLAKGDVYTEEAKEYFQLPASFTKKDLKPESRMAAKIIRLARQYGAGKKVVFKSAIKMDRTFTWERCIALMGAFDRRYHRTVSWWEEEHERVLKCGYSASRILDRRRVYPAVPDRPETANYPIQSTASDIKNLALIELDAYLKRHIPKAKIVIDLHDAIYVNAPKKSVKTVMNIMKEVAETPRYMNGQLHIFPANVAHAERWSDVLL